MNTLDMHFYNVTLRNGQTYKIWADSPESAQALVLFDRELVTPQNRQAEQIARPKVELWQPPFKAQPEVKGDFSVGDSMVTIFRRTFVRRAK